MFRGKSKSRKSLLLISLIGLLTVLTLVLTYSRLRPRRLPPRGEISPLLHAQNLSHGAFHNPATKPYLLRLVSTPASKHVVIIGLANGNEALQISRTHAVHAVEPLPEYVARFRARDPRTTQNITLHPVAASDANGELEIAYRGSRHVVTARRVDELLPADAHLAVVSVDIQGAEYAALRGMQDALRRCNSVWVEVTCGKKGRSTDKPLELLRFLERHFVLFDFVPWGRQYGVDDMWDYRQFHAAKRPSPIRQWSRAFCAARQNFKWMQTDVLGVSRSLLEQRPGILEGLKRIGELNCERGCYLREAVAKGLIG